MKKIILLLILLLIILLGCSRGELLTKNYYILEYYDHTELAQLKQEIPLDLSVYIMDTKVSKTYNRNQLVIRHYGPRITYAYYDLWGVKLSKIIPDLIQKRLQAYNIFDQTYREILGVNPDMEIITNLNNIELYESESVQSARVNMDFILRKVGQEGILVQHSLNVERELASADVETFVQTANEIILQEIDRFIAKILINSYGEEVAAIPNIDSVREQQIRTILMDDEKDAPDGNGLLYLPALSNSENEPIFIALGADGSRFEGKMGEPLPLLEGVYSVHFGTNFKLTKENVQIIPRYKTIIEPDWGCLVVDIIDEQRNYAKVSYEIFNMDGESFGGGFPAEEEIGEQPTVYVLEKGTYKITINNEPFNTYRDFTTIYVEPGEMKRLTIVVETDEDDNPLSMIGAGILEENLLGDSNEKLKFSSAIHGNANLNSDNEQDRNKSETTITLNTQLQNYLLYDGDKLHYSMKNLVELGTQKSTDQDFRLAVDEFDLKNTLIYYFFKNIGFYSRFDLNTHFFNTKLYFNDNFYCTKIDIDGNVVQDSALVDFVRVESSFFPLVLKEGLGINYRILNRAKANLSLRVGFGLRQDINNDVYQLYYSDETGSLPYLEYHEIDSESKTGTEVSLVGSFNLPWSLTYTTNADFLFPFGEEQDYTMEWENVFNMKLFKFISLDYKLKLTHKMPDVSQDYIALNHSLFLRVTYFLR